MIQIMIVDDMPIFLDYLRACIDWEAYGFEICCEAHDGKEALEKLDEYYPDVVLTDITMPYLNGLELAEIITRDYPDVSVILITGNNEFEYARKAVKIGVCDYIVKPFEKEELILSLLKLQDNIGKAVENEDDGDPLASEELRALIYTGTVKPHMFERQDESGGFLVSLIRFDGSRNEGKNSKTFENLMNWENLIAKLLKGKLEIDGEFKIFHDLENDIVVIMNFNKGHDADSYKGYEFTDIIGVIKNQLEIECSIAMDKADSIEGVRRAYERVLGYLPQKPLGMLYDIRKIEDKGNYASIKDIYRLNHDIESLSLSDVTDAINAMDTGKAGMNLLYSAVSVLMTNVISSGFPVEGIFGEGFSTEFFFDGTESMEEAKEKVIELYRKRIEYETGRNLPSKNKSKEVADSVKKYIDAHYSDCELTMNDISKELGVNQTYLRKMFKSETGMTLTEYITKIRLETAVKIMKETGASLSEIAENVGFSDSSYFSKVFKKCYGVCPKSIKLENTNN